VDNTSLALQAGNIVVAGATTAGDFILRRYDSTGALDHTFGTSGAVVVNLGAFDNAFSVALYPDPDNRIVVSGNTGSALPSAPPCCGLPGRRA
jgi:hypothetical protein